MSLEVCRFLDAGNNETLRTLSEPASKKRQGTKSRELGAGWQRVLWGLCVGAELDGGREASTTPPACLHVPEVGRVQKAFRRALGAHQRAIDALMDVIGSTSVRSASALQSRGGRAKLCEPPIRSTG